MPCEPTVFVCQFVYVGNGFLTLQGGSVPIYPLLGWINGKIKYKMSISTLILIIFPFLKKKMLFNQCLLEEKVGCIATRMRCYTTENPLIKRLQTAVCSRFCLFSPNTPSTVSTYADESVLNKFTFLSRCLPACR